MDNFQSCLSNSKLLYANSFSLIESKIRHWERVNQHFVGKCLIWTRLEFCCLVNSTKQQNLRLVQIQSICRRKIQHAKIMIAVCDRIEKIVGKGENAGYQHFLLFPQCFQKLSCSGSLKPEVVW